MSFLTFKSTLVVAAALLLAFLSSSSTSSFVSAGFVGATWADTFEGLVASFKDEPQYRSFLVQMMFHTSVKDMQYADVLCSKPQFVRCVGAPPGLSKGTANSPAWPIEITVQHYHSDRTVHWKYLPSNTVLVRIINPLAEEVDLSRLMTMLPNYVTKIEIEGAKLSASSPEELSVLDRNSKKNPRVGEDAGGGEDQQQQQQVKAEKPDSESFIVKLSLRHCDIQQKFFDVFSPSSSAIKNGGEDSKNDALRFTSLKEFTISHCKLPAQDNDSNNNNKDSSSSASLATMLVTMSGLEKLRIIENSGGILDFDDLLENFLEKMHQISSTIQILDLQQQATAADSSSNSKRKIIIDDAKFSQNLAKMKELEELTIANVGLKSIPSQLPPGIKKIALIATGLEKVPELDPYATLESVDLRGNKISQFPQTLPENIKRISLAHNALADTLDLSQIPRHLVELNVSGNELHGAADLTKLPPQIEIFDISHNKFAGPVNMRQFPDSIRHLHINDNKFTGRYDVSKLPLLSVRIAFGNNDWDSMMPPRRGKKNGGKK